MHLQPRRAGIWLWHELLNRVLNRKCNRDSDSWFINISINIFPWLSHQCVQLVQMAVWNECWYVKWVRNICKQCEYAHNSLMRNRWKVLCLVKLNCFSKSSSSRICDSASKLKRVNVFRFSWLVFLILRKFNWNLTTKGIVWIIPFNTMSPAPNLEPFLFFQQKSLCFLLSFTFFSCCHNFSNSLLFRRSCEKGLERGDTNVYSHVPPCKARRTQIFK